MSEKRREHPTKVHQTWTLTWQKCVGEKILEFFNAKFSKRTFNKHPIWKSDALFCWIFEVGAVQKSVSLVDLVKSVHTNIYYFFAEIGFDTAENEPLKIRRWFNSYIHSPPATASRNGISPQELRASESWNAALFILSTVARAQLSRQEH